MEDSFNAMTNEFRAFLWRQRASKPSQQLHITWAADPGCLKVCCRYCPMSALRRKLSTGLLMRTGHDNHDIPTVADLIISHLSLSLISNYSPLTLTKIECPPEKNLHF